MFGRKCVVFAALACVVTSEGAMLHRTKRQNFPEEGGQVIDKIFDIPITAIKQTAAAAHSFSPENSHLVDSVFKIPVSTLEAVGNLVKATSGQRRQNADELQRIRQERRERIIAQRERQRFQREQLQQQRIKQLQTKKTLKLKDKDPFGLNSLAFLVGNHGILGSIQGVFGGHGGHGGHGGNGGHGGHGSHGSGGSHGGTSDNNQNTYEVHENIEEDTNYSWHGITAGFGSFHGSRPTQADITIQNKIAPKDKLSNGYKLQHKISNSRDRPFYDEDAPLENKIAPKSNRISFRS